MADPLTLSLIGLGLGGLGGAASLFSPKPSAPTLPPMAPPVQPPVGDQSTNKTPAGPSFLAAAAAPQTNQTAGQKTLLGQ